jgi:hypothetical protein
MDIPKNIYVYISYWQDKPAIRSGIKTVVRNYAIALVEQLQTVGVHSLSHPIVNVIHGLGSLRVENLNLRVISNQQLPFHLEELVTLGGSTAKINSSTVVVDADSYENPFSMTWEHKNLLRQDVDCNTDPQALFLYLEHDQLFVQHNLSYFVSSNALMQDCSTRPSFIRYEMSSDRVIPMFTDVKSKPWHQNSQILEIQGRNFRRNPIGYSGMYLMTADEAAKHLLLGSSSETESYKIFPAIGISERAAIGPLYDSILNTLPTKDRDQKTNSFVRVGGDGHSIHPGALIWHLSNRYASNKQLHAKRKYGSIQVPTGFTE